MGKFPKVNYIGNKEKIVNWIIDNLPIKEGRVLDIFSGGGSVSYALKENGYEVYSNDALYSDFVLGKALVENKNVTISENIFNIEVSEDEVLRRYNKIIFLSNKVYFDYEVKELAKLITISEKISNEYERYLFLALLRRAMIRKIPYSRMNVKWEEIKKFRDEEYSYKKYKRRRSYHNLSFEEHMRLNMRDYNNAVFDNGKENKCFNEDALKIISQFDIDFDIIYMDPPYPTTMNKYSDFYGMYDEAIDHEIEYTDFTNKRTFLANLEELIKKCYCKTKYIVISESNRTKPSVDELMKMLSKYGETSLYTKPYQYRVTGKTNKNEAIEMLLVLKIKQN